MQFFFKVVFAIIYVKDGKLENGFTNKFSKKKYDSLNTDTRKKN